MAVPGAVPGRNGCFSDGGRAAVCKKTRAENGTSAAGGGDDRGGGGKPRRLYYQTAGFLCVPGRLCRNRFFAGRMGEAGERACGRRLYLSGILSALPHGKYLSGGGKAPLEELYQHVWPFCVQREIFRDLFPPVRRRNYFFPVQ